MFIKLYKPKCPSYRNKIRVSSFLSNIKGDKSLKISFFKKKIYNNHKFLSNSNTIYKLNMNKTYIGYNYLIKLFKSSYSNVFMGFFKFFNGSICIRKLNYGINFTESFNNEFFFSNLLLNYSLTTFNKYYLALFTYETKISFLICNLSKKIFSSSAGTFCFIQTIEEENILFISDDLFYVKLPSKKSLYFEIISTAFLGRVSNVFSKFSFYSSFSTKFLLKKKKQSTRGVAKNPVDHPNGGRSKVKTPFKNPWGIIAKKGK